MTQADTKYWDLGFEDFGDGVNRIVARLWIARTVGQEYAIGIHCQYIRCGCLCRYNDEFAAAIDKHTQYVAFDAVVVGHYFKFGGAWLLGFMPNAQFPAVL